MRIRVQTIGPYLATAAVLIAMVGFVVTLGVGLFLQERTDERLCRVNVANREAIRSTWLAARELILPTADDPEALNAFFTGVLKPIPPLECVDNQPVPKEG